MHLLAILNFTSFVSSAGYAAVFILCLLQSCCVPTSSELTMGLAGALAAQGKLSLPGVVAVGVLGEVVGAYIAWAVGRYAGRAVVDRYGRYLLVSQHDLDRAEAWYQRHQRFGVFGSRLLPVIRNFVALPAGIAEVPLGRFGVLTAAGSLLWDGAWAGIGYGVGSHWHAIAKAFGDIGYVLAAVAAGVIAFAAYHRYRSYTEAASEGQRPVLPDGRPRPAGPRHLAGARTALRDGPGEAGPTLRPSGGAPTGTLRWIASSSGRPPPRPSPPPSPSAQLSRLDLSPVGVAPGADRLVASSSGRVARPRRGDFPHSPIAAWEAAVLSGRRGSAASAEPLSVEPLLEEDAGGAGANARLTAMLGALLLVLLAVEGISILRVSALLTLHVVIGMVLVPVIVLKIGATTWRFARYYLGSPEYRRRGPPPALLRLLGPFVVVSTVAVVGSGIAALLAPTSLRNEVLLLHKVTFVLWFAAMVVHVLGHLLDMARLAPRDFYRRTRRQVRGAGMRQWAIAGAVCVGILLGVALAPKVGPWLAHSLSVGKPANAHPVVTTPGPSHRAHR